MSKYRLIIPEARRALYNFKMETGDELNKKSLQESSPKHTDIIARELMRIGEKKITDKE